MTLGFLCPDRSRKHPSATKLTKSIPPDREIFRVRDEIRAQEGADVTFYDVLSIHPSASQDDITKAYRKLTRSLHPDKVRQQLVAERAAKRKDSKGGSKKPGVHVAKPPSESEIRAAQ